LLGKAFLGPHLLEQGVSTIASIAERIGSAAVGVLLAERNGSSGANI
jgi:hypothetical protein